MFIDRYCFFGIKLILFCCFLIVNCVGIKNAICSQEEYSDLKKCKSIMQNEILYTQLYHLDKIVLKFKHNQLYKNKIEKIQRLKKLMIEKEKMWIEKVSPFITDIQNDTRNRIILGRITSTREEILTKKKEFVKNRIEIFKKLANDLRELEKTDKNPNKSLLSFCPKENQKSLENKNQLKSKKTRFVDLENFYYSLKKEWYKLDAEVEKAYKLLGEELRKFDRVDKNKNLNFMPFSKILSVPSEKWEKVSDISNDDLDEDIKFKEEEFKKLQNIDMKKQIRYIADDTKKRIEGLSKPDENGNLINQLTYNYSDFPERLIDELRIENFMVCVKAVEKLLYEKIINERDPIKSFM
ncbi:MAG: hypothetical protein HQK49_01330 [Oligoflexia bacterium]|nr:hypothetical protein [Oligoflexia bacterium]